MSCALDLPKEVYKGEDGRWYKPCPSCGDEQSYLRRNYAIMSYNDGKECKSCSNKKPENNAHKGWIKGVLRSSFARKYQTNAALRGIDWEVTFEYLADLLIEQDFKCALTGWNIDAMEVNQNTASLDRVDSHKGYIEGNIQWVHKMVNMSKQQYTQEKFIEMCAAVADKVKW
tara:strand:- start:3148 stop:3663 length:516 start_codon:yes stop_codon:yes gene_type:complete